MANEFGTYYSYGDYSDSDEDYECGETNKTGDLLVEDLEGENVISLYLMSEMDTDW